MSNPSADHDDGNLRAALTQLLQCPALADKNHSDPAWGCAETAQAISVARAALSPNHQPHAVSQGWRDIETAPRDGTLIDLWCIDRRGNYAPRRLTERQYGRMTNWVGEIVVGWNIGNPYRDWQPTHWMPLPAPPSPAKTGGAE